MNKPGNGIHRTSPVRQPVLLGLFTGTAVGVGYLLAGVPNVELMTLVIALAGTALGLPSGFLAGVLAAAIFSLGSPYGVPHPVLLAAQSLGLGLAGVIGGLGARRLINSLGDKRHLTTLVWAGATGLLATALYDIFTNLAIIIAFDMTPLVVFTGAVPFFLIHAGVNTVVFVSLLPLLAPRLALLGKAPLTGKSGGGVVVLALLGMMIAVGEAPAQETVPTETVASVEDSTLVAEETDPELPSSITVKGPKPMSESSQRASDAMGWKRGLWTPFAPTALTELNWYSPWVPVSDGGLGSMSMVLGEAGTHRNPTFVRDGIPVGTGHVLADDPVLVSTEGLVIQDRGMGRDGRGGSGGLIELRTDDPDPGKAVSSYRGIKGNHETYFRAIHVLTPQAAWRAAFEFEESMDNEGYNYTEDPDEIFALKREDGFPGHSKVRQSRTRIFRQLDDENGLVFEYSNGRKTKDSLPVLGADNQEVWDDGISATMTARTGSWNWRTSVFWKNRDIEWGDRDTVSVGSERRKVETGREGFSIDLARAGAGESSESRSLHGLNLLFTNWKVYDTGTSADWAEGYQSPDDGKGQDALLAARTGFRTGGTLMRFGLGAQWAQQAGFGPELSLDWGADDQKPWWNLDLYYGGRAPRSDELLTPLLHVVDGRELSLLPNPDLEREKTLRAGLLLQKRLLGLDLAVDGSVRRLTNGISWVELEPDADRGVWRNGLEMDAARVSARVGREGRFLGWGRVMLEGTWQSFEEKVGRASYLPPDKYLRLHVMWENHFFKEDGVLQLALFSTRQPEMADPWDVTRTYLLPARTVHDLLVGFRLVGVNLSLAFRNFAGEKTRMTAGSLSHTQELDMRLYWKFLY